MIIKGIWVFDYPLNKEKVKSSLVKLLEFYPHVAGRMNGPNEIVLNNGGIYFSNEEYHISVLSLIKQPRSFDLYKTPIKIKKLVNGKEPLMSVKIVRLKDGCLLIIHCAHVCLDGNGFFRFVKNLEQLYQNKPIQPIDLDRSNLFFDKIPSKNKAYKLMLEKGWKQVSINTLVQYTWQKFRRIEKIVSPPIHISEDYLSAIQKQIEKKGISHLSKHALLSSILIKLSYKLNNFKTTTNCSLVSVIDLKGRLSSFPTSYAGNATSNITTRDFNPENPLSDLAVIIDNTIAKYLLQNTDLLEEHVLLNIAASKYKIPFTPFDLQAMNAQKPTCLYVNNFLKFKLYDIDFGMGTPVLILPNDLPDALKIWPSQPDKPGINVYLRGQLGKTYNKVKNKQIWLENFFNHTAMNV